MTTSLENHDKLQEMTRTILPPLDGHNHKGDAGRVGVVGGCDEYTGAPYYAAISSLRVGCDLSHVFCTKEAAPVIKAYSPELIVHPLLGVSSNVAEIATWMERLHSMVIGPGLGRNPNVINTTKEIILKAKALNLPVVIDADGLHIITEQPDLIKGYTKVILTPNVVEFSRLYKTLVGSVPGDVHTSSSVSTVAKCLGNVTIVLKGPTDIIGDGVQTLVCKTEGSARRCGGQGDLLSGSLGTFSYWSHRAMENPRKHELLVKYGASMCAAYASCHLTRLCNYKAFEKHHRSTITTDMIQEISNVMQHSFK